MAKSYDMCCTCMRTCKLKDHRRIVLISNSSTWLIFFLAYRSIESAYLRQGLSTQCKIKKRSVIYNKYYAKCDAVKQSPHPCQWQRELRIPVSKAPRSNSDIFGLSLGNHWWQHNVMMHSAPVWQRRPWMCVNTDRPTLRRRQQPTSDKACLSVRHCHVDVKRQS